MKGGINGGPGDSHPPMKGGINGGLVLFEPSADTYKDMMDELHDFRPKTKMAEQEFLSYYWGRSGSWHAMHKKYNFQIHQLYFASPEPPPGQDRQSWFAYNTAPTHGTLSCGTIWASGDQRRALLANDARLIAMRAVVSMALPTAVLAAARLLKILM